MVGCIIGRRAPEFDRVRDLRSKLREYQIDYDKNLYLLNTISKSDPRYNRITNKCFNLRNWIPMTEHEITHEIKRLAEKGIYKGVIRK